MISYTYYMHIDLYAISYAIEEVWLKCAVFSNHSCHVSCITCAKLKYLFSIIPFSLSVMKMFIESSCRYVTSHSVLDWTVCLPVRMPSCLWQRQQLCYYFVFESSPFCGNYTNMMSFFVSTRGLWISFLVYNNPRVRIAHVTEAF